MSYRTCSFEGCDRKHYAKDLCHSHYNQQWLGKSLSPLKRSPIPVAQRLAKYIVADEVTGCRLFDGGSNVNGYRYAINGNGAMEVVHRIVFKLEHGPIPDGLECHHYCYRRNCVEHVALVTRKFNMADVAKYKKETAGLTEEQACLMWIKRGVPEWAAQS